MSSLAILGGLLILVQGLLDVANVVPFPPPEPFLGLVRSIGGFVVVGAVSIVAGLLVIYGGWMIMKDKRKMGSRLAIVFAIVGFAGGGGFIIGTLMGVVGGLMYFRTGQGS